VTQITPERELVSLEIHRQVTQVTAISVSACYKKRKRKRKRLKPSGKEQQREVEQ